MFSNASYISCRTLAPVTTVQYGCFIMGGILNNITCSRFLQDKFSVRAKDNTSNIGSITSIKHLKHTEFTFIL